MLNLASSSNTAGDFGGGIWEEAPEILLVMELEDETATWRNRSEESRKTQRKRMTMIGTVRWKRCGMSMALSCHVGQVLRRGGGGETGNVACDNRRCAVVVVLDVSMWSPVVYPALVPHNRLCVLSLRTDWVGGD